jgi:signal transduction histidine kinase/ActR/RegA family two-component response regulator
VSQAQPPVAADDAAMHAAGGATHRQSAVARQVDEERVAMVYSLTATPALAGLAFAVLVAFVLWPYRPGAVVVGWLLVKIIISATRLRDVHRFARSPSRREHITEWRRRSDISVVLDGACWGAMGVIFMPDEAPGVQMVILAALIGVAGSGVFSYIGLARGCIFFLFALLLPSVVFQIQRGTDAGWFAALGMLIYLTLMIIEARRGEARVIEMLRLRFENAFIAEERHRALLLAEHSSAAKSRFLATVSHEMRTPLNGIMGMTQLLQRSTLSPEQIAQLDTIHSSSQHLQTVISDLLDLSRIEFGKLALDERPIALQTTVRAVTDLLQAVAQDQGLAFRVEFAPALSPWVVADASRIKQVLHNLIGNAIKFTHRGEVAVHVVARGDELCFVIRDSGDGIPRDVASRIFDAFEQGPSSPQDARSGTGLGLTISRQIARAMGGDVVCEPGAGRGATFVFTLPLRPAAAQIVTPPQAVAIATPQFAGHVLVVDDNPVNALVASAMLERMGVRTDVAEDGEQALRLMESSRYDLVLMDCQLPVMDGWEATRRWRLGEDAAQRLPIVALTANAVVGDRERCLQSGMDDYLAKPFEMEALADVVGRHIRPRRRAA